MNLNNIEDLARKNLGWILIFLLIGVGLALPLSQINLGFEGAKCHYYGVHLPDLGGSWIGDNQFHAYNDAETPLASQDNINPVGSLVGEDFIEWTNVATPNDAGLTWYGWDYPLTPRHYALPDLKIHVENNIQLQEITRQGADPLGWGDDDELLAGRRIEYWSLKSTKTSETEDKVIYEYEVEKESFLIVPAEFWVGFHLLPSQKDAGTGSGWREGEWQKLTMWFRLDFHTWDNAYYDEWLDDPQADVYTSEYGGTITSEQKLVPPDAYKGGFPISGWIQGWEKAGWSSHGNAESPVWWTVEGATEEVFTDEQLWEMKQILMSKVAFSPGMVGSFLNLYDAPESQFTYEPDYTSYDNYQGLATYLKSPDASMKKVMYFPFTIDNLGTYAQDQGWWGLAGWKVYYPSAYFRIRMIYGVYGTFKYLWTEEVTKEFTDPDTGEYIGGLDYPDDFERKGTTVITTTGPISPFIDLGAGIASWFSNPLNQLLTMGIIMVAIVVIVTILNPGLWSSLADIYGGRKGGKRRT